MVNDDYWTGQSMDDYACAQDRRYEEMAREYGVHPLDHFHWRVTCTFDDGFQHVSDWHASLLDAQRVVHEEARIKHEQKYGHRGCAKTIGYVPLDIDGNVLTKEVAVDKERPEGLPTHEETQAWHEVWLVINQLGEYREGETAPEALRRIVAERGLGPKTKYTPRG